METDRKNGRNYFNNRYQSSFLYAIIQSTRNFLVRAVISFTVLGIITGLIEIVSRVLTLGKC